MRLNGYNAPPFPAPGLGHKGVGDGVYAFRHAEEPHCLLFLAAGRLSGEDEAPRLGAQFLGKLLKPLFVILSPFLVSLLTRRRRRRRIR